MKPYYITTPIYYVNDRPHIGHCFTTLVADVAARFQRLARGGPPSPAPVFFLTGTDEHADKVVTSAAANHTTPQAWADLNAEQFRRAFDSLQVTNSDFIRTTEPRHAGRVPTYIAALQAAGDIYKGQYTGWYDEGQEEYLTETAAKDAQYRSPINARPLVRRTEDCYFFRLSAYQQALLGHINQHPGFILPESRRNEVLGRLRQGLNDVPVSRPVTSDPATQWGIRMPADDANRVYVWIDALFNYLTVVDTPDRRHLWPADVHLIGKDILWFHAVIWPALLMALRKSAPDFAWVDLPRCVFGHGWWIAEGQKMSKSLGNFIDLPRLDAYARRYSLDALRWYLLAQGPLAGTDADFSHARFVEVYNADLANAIGNSTSRVGNMIARYFDGVVPPPLQGRAGEGLPIPESDALAAEFPYLCRATVERSLAALDEFDLPTALRLGIDLVARVDLFINQTQPFKLAKTVDADPSARGRLADILYTCAETLRVASLLLSPAMPDKMATLWRDWNCHAELLDASADRPALESLARFAGPHALKPGAPLSRGDPLFMRADPAEPAPQ
ncbi:MAG: methionine--tRNA ligase [Phycisphaerae bacterium]|nr:methionine--tRNA ligase [Phycisphaerae bacterium]